MYRFKWRLCRTTYLLAVDDWMLT